MSESERQRQNGDRIVSNQGRALTMEGVKTRETLQELLATDAPEETRLLFPSELSRDHALGNMSEAELHEYRFFVENSRLIVKAKFPPPESAMQGELRDVCYGEDTEPLTTDQLHSIRDAPWLAKQRASRSKNFRQQEAITEQTKRQYVDDNRGEDNKSFIQKILGGR